MSQKNKIWGKNKFGKPPLPLGVDFLGFFSPEKNEKCLESPEMEINLIRKFSYFLPPLRALPLSDMCAEKILLVLMGAERRVKRAQTHVLSSFLFLFCVTYFSPRRGCPRVMKNKIWG